MREMTTFKYDENAAKTLSNFNQNFILLSFSNSVNFNLSKSMKTPFSFKVRTMRWNLFLFLSEEMVDLSLQFFAFFVWSHYIVLILKICRVFLAFVMQITVDNQITHAKSCIFPGYCEPFI